MTKYIILHISGKFYFTNFKCKAPKVQEFEIESEVDALSDVLSEFCSNLNSKFEVHLYSDTLTLHTIDLSQQAPGANSSLLEQFILFELENVVDLLPDRPALKYIKEGNNYHCLLADENEINDLKNVCLQFGGKLSKIGHPAGLLSSLNKNNSIEVYDHTVYAQSASDKISFNLNSSLPTEYDGVQRWVTSKALRNASIYNLAGHKVIPIEGSLEDVDFREINSKDLVKISRSRTKSHPALIFNRSNISFKKYIPLIASFFISLAFFLFSIISKGNTNKKLENELDKSKRAKSEFTKKKTDYLSNFKKIPDLEKKISSLKAQEIVYQNVKFWPGLLENLASVFDEYSQLKKVETQGDSSVSIEGITMNVLQMQKVVSSLEADKKLNLSILEKSVNKESINGTDIWNFSIKVKRNQ